MTPVSLIDDLWRADDALIGEQVVFVGAACAELRHDGALRPTLKLMPCLRIDRVLFARIEDDFVPHGVSIGAVGGRLGDRIGRRLP